MRAAYGFGLVFRWALAILLGLAVGVAIGGARPGGVLAGIASIVVGMVAVALIVGPFESFGKPKRVRTRMDDRAL
jgi:hypothetical protein